tara:strand:- start:254 stop:598 length:345 start_codon:yes stop_codon:yes gene_type:complete
MSSILQFKGTIYQIKEVQQITDTFSKMEFILTDNAPEYAKFINFELVKDNISLLDNFAEGQEVTVNFNLEGRLWTNKEGVEKCFNSLKAWKIEGETIPATEVPAPTVSTEDLPF